MVEERVVLAVTFRDPNVIALAFLGGVTESRKGSIWDAAETARAHGLAISTVTDETIRWERTLDLWPYPDARPWGA